MDCLDFDRFLSEKRREYVQVTVLGKSYRVCREIPALVPLLLARAGEDGDRAQLGRALLRTGDVLFGREIMDDFARQGLSANDLTALVERTINLICGAEQDGETLDDAGRPLEGEGKK